MTPKQTKRTKESVGEGEGGKKRPSRPLMWWTHHVQEFPHPTRMTRHHLTVPATSPSPERLFNSVGFVKSDLWGSLLDRTLCH
jgi:hypothetical protein